MSRQFLAFVTATLLLLLLVAPVSAADGCPPPVSGFRAGEVNQEWEVGDPIPTGDVLWEETVLAGLAEEGLTMGEALELFDLATAEELYAFALEGWRELDRNGDGTICFNREHQNGLPAYLANFIDNNGRGLR